MTLLNCCARNVSAGLLTLQAHKQQRARRKAVKR